MGVIKRREPSERASDISESPGESREHESQPFTADNLIAVEPASFSFGVDSLYLQDLSFLVLNKV
jgi:hypothetical protein